MKTITLKLNPENPDRKSLSKAASVIKNGGLVAFPTETVYGIAVNFLDPSALDKLYKVKNRPRSKPFTIHVSNLEMLGKMGCSLTKEAARLAEKFWPGPLTIILKSKNGESLGFRMPANKVALELIDSAGVPVVAPSANISGGVPPKEAKEVLEQLDGKIDILIDTGKTDLGMESTVLDLTGSEPKILREGAIKKKEIFETIKMNKVKSVLFVCTGNSCRSVIAEGIFKKMLKGLGKDGIDVKSCGISAMNGASPTVETIEVMKKEGIDVSAQKSRRITEDLIKGSDLILVMEESHKEEVIKRVPEAKSKTYLLKEFGLDDKINNSDSYGIADPIGMPIEYYQTSLKAIKKELERIAKIL